MRWAELALFLVPFALYAAWRLAAAAARTALVFGAIAAALAVFAAGMIWLDVSRRLAPSQAYVPARIVDGQIVPGHAAGGSARP
jgi:hypothetical protein